MTFEADSIPDYCLETIIFTFTVTSQIPTAQLCTSGLCDDGVTACTNSTQCPLFPTTTKYIKLSYRNSALTIRARSSPRRHPVCSAARTSALRFGEHWDSRRTAASSVRKRIRELASRSSFTAFTGATPGSPLSSRAWRFLPPRRRVVVSVSAARSDYRVRRRIAQAAVTANKIIPMNSACGVSVGATAAALLHLPS